MMSMKATASMYPAPNARKYCSTRRDHSLRTTKYPPIKFPAAATSPSPAASAVRNAKSCAIFGVRRFTPAPSGPGGRSSAPINSPILKRLCFLPALLRAPCESLCSVLTFFLNAPPAMPEKNHIPFLHDVFFPLQPHLRLFPRRRQTSCRQQVIPSHHFRPNETLLNVAMNRARRLHRGRALANRPRPHFRLPGREKLDQSQQIIRRANQSVQPRLLQSVRRQQLRSLFLIHLGAIRLPPPADRRHGRIGPTLE